MPFFRKKKKKEWHGRADARATSYALSFLLVIQLEKIPRKIMFLHEMQEMLQVVMLHQVLEEKTRVGLIMYRALLVSYTLYFFTRNV